MKKYIVFTTLLLATVFLASCSNGVPVTQISEYQPNVTGGSDDEIFFGEISNLPLIDQETVLMTSFPVYVDQYPVDEGGPLFDIDRPMIDFMTDKLIQFLKILHNEDNVSGYSIEYDPGLSHKVCYQASDATKMVSGASDISIITSEYRIADDAANGELLENSLVQAALKYMNIENPQTASSIHYAANGNIYEYQYVITEATESFLESVLNSSFSYVRIICNPDSTEVFFRINKIDISELYSEEPILPYEEAAEYIQTAYDVPDQSEIDAEIYYSYSVQPGYIVPCYKFYIKGNTEENRPSGNAGEDMYKVVHIPMISVNKVFGD